MSEGGCWMSEPNSRRLPRNHQNPPFSRFGRISGRETGVAGCRSRTHVGCYEIIKTRHFRGLGRISGREMGVAGCRSRTHVGCHEIIKTRHFQGLGRISGRETGVAAVGAELTSAATKSSKTRHFRGLGAFQAGKRHFINLDCVQTMSVCPFTHSFCLSGGAFDSFIKSSCPGIKSLCLQRASL